MARYLRHGFSLVEMLIVIGIMIVIAGLTVPYLQSFQVSSDVRTYADTLTHALRRAQQFAQTGQASSAWGVKIDDPSKQFIVYRGTTFALRPSNLYDQPTDYSDAVSITADFGDDISFALFSGTATASGTIQISNTNGDTHTIVITAYGTIKQSE